MSTNCNFARICGSIAAAAVLATFASGCGNAMSDTDATTTDQPEADTKEASFLSDGDSVAPDSPEAAGILTLANEASYTKLDETVGLDRRAAYHISSYRMGDDDTPGTADDRTIDSLEELDDIYWVGPHAVSQLLDYANQHGYVDATPSGIHGIAPNSDTAKGVLRLANEASLSTLDEDVRLDVRAARHIVEYRNGPDGEAGSDDDRHFAGLAELDRVDWVSERAFGKMLTYAENHHYIPADTWRDIFDGGRVEVTLQPVDGSCTRRRCIYSRHGASGTWQCNETRVDEPGSVVDLADFRITGKNPDKLTVAYAADSLGEGWRGPIDDDGEFTLGGRDVAATDAVTDKREVTGSLYRDHVHSATYSHTYETEQKRRYLDCSLTLERTRD